MTKKRAVTGKKRHIVDAEYQKDKQLLQAENNVLPYQAYAIVGSREDPGTWQLPHHTRQISRAVQGKIGYKHTVDWQLMERAVQLLSLRGIEGQRIVADESQVISAAQHLASHYRAAGKPLPDALAVLV